VTFGWGFVMRTGEEAVPRLKEECYDYIGGQYGLDEKGAALHDTVRRISNYGLVSTHHCSHALLKLMLVPSGSSQLVTCFLSVVLDRAVRKLETF